MNKDLLKKFLNNNCTEVELNKVLRWAETIALDEEEKKLGFDDWKNYRENTNLSDDEKFVALFDRIQKVIDADTIKPIEHKKTSLSVYTAWLTRAAAILLIPALAFLFYTLSERKSVITQNTVANVDSLEVIAPIGSRTVVQLSDGSEVHLNYGSKIKYPQFFSGETREIILEGEGFFKVAHNPRKPFIVKTGKLNVKALGTTFNVLAYKDLDLVETTLVNGKVIMERNTLNGQTKLIGTMVPGQHVEYDTKKGVIKSSIGNVEDYIAWKEGMLVFDDTPITKVVEKLNRKYNVDIEVDDDLEDFIYTVTFGDEPLFQILDLMTIATPVCYDALPRKKLPDGTFSKQKIIIKKIQ